MIQCSPFDFYKCPEKKNLKNSVFKSTFFPMHIVYDISFSIQSYRSCYTRLYLCQRPFYKIPVKVSNSKLLNVLKIVLIIVNMNKGEGQDKKQIFECQFTVYLVFNVHFDVFHMCCIYLNEICRRFQFILYFYIYILILKCSNSIPGWR